MPSGAVLGALGGSAVGPVFAAVVHRLGKRSDAEGGTASCGEGGFVLAAIAAGNALVLAGAVAIAMAGARSPGAAAVEIAAAAVAPVPYVVYRALRPRS